MFEGATQEWKAPPAEPKSDRTAPQPVTLTFQDHRQLLNFIKEPNATNACTQNHLCISLTKRCQVSACTRGLFPYWTHVAVGFCTSLGRVRKSVSLTRCAFLSDTRSNFRKTSIARSALNQRHEAGCPGRSCAGRHSSGNLSVCHDDRSPGCNKQQFLRFHCCWGRHRWLDGG